MSILITKLLMDSGFSDVRCYAFSPWPGFGPLHRIESEWSDALDCFVHADDLMETLCLVSARRLALEIERIHKKVDLDMKQKRTIEDGNQASVTVGHESQTIARKDSTNYSFLVNVACIGSS